MGEPFFSRPGMMTGFAAVFQHHGDEVRRLTDPNGAVVFSSWMRRDEHQPEGGTNLRVGDTRATPETWNRFFDAFGRTQPVLSERIYGPDDRRTLNAFVLEP